MGQRTVVATAMTSLLLGLTPALANANLELATRKNCMACHKLTGKMVGSGFKEIAEKYAGVTDAEDVLTNSVLRGTSSAGALPMPANAQVSSQEARILVRWILQGTPNFSSTPQVASGSASQSNSSMADRNREADQALSILGAVIGSRTSTQQGTQAALASLVNSQSSASTGVNRVPDRSKAALSDQECIQRISSIQRQADGDVQANRNDAAASARVLYASNEAQKALFEGQCSSHPRARAYVTAADQGIREWGSRVTKAQQPSTPSAQDAQQVLTSQQQDELIQKQINQRYEQQARQIKTAQTQAEFDRFRQQAVQRQKAEEQRAVAQQSTQKRNTEQAKRGLDDSIFRGFEAVAGRTHVNTLNVAGGVLAEMSTSNELTITGGPCADGIQVYNESGHAAQVSVRFRWLQKYDCNQGLCSYRNAYDTVVISLRSPDARSRRFFPEVQDDIRVRSTSGLTCNGTWIESASVHYLD